MKGLLGFFKQSTRASQEDNTDSVLFSTAFADLGVDASMLVPWEARANEIGAKRMSATHGSKLLQTLWAKDKYMSRLTSSLMPRIEQYFDFATVAAGRDIIRQDEHGDFMVVLLTGIIAIDREQPWGERLRLAEACPGDLLGEMSLLDSGMRFSLCTSVTDCEIAVLSAPSLDEMMLADPALAAGLIALLACKLSRRMRVVSARLSDKKK